MRLYNEDCGEKRDVKKTAPPMRAAQFAFKSAVFAYFTL